MSKTNPLLKFTQYFKGEIECPKSCAYPNIWYYEKMWVENAEERAEDNYRMIVYKQKVLPLYDEDDDIPLSLKALLYNRHTHWGGGYGLENDVRSFKEFLERDYLGRK